MNSSSTDVHNMKYQAKKRFLERKYFCLKKLLQKTVTHQSQFIEHDQLAAFNISVTDFSLYSDLACDAVPRFFKPSPHDLMEESFENSSELGDDLWWPPHDPHYRACFTEPHDVEAILDRYHSYVIEEREENPSWRRTWQSRW